VESYDYCYSEDALEDLARLAKRERQVYQEAIDVLADVCAAPNEAGYPLKREWEGCRALHFGRDRYRFVWEPDDEAKCLAVLRVGKRGAQAVSIYDLPRPSSPLTTPEPNDGLSDEGHA